MPTYRSRFTVTAEGEKQTSHLKRAVKHKKPDNVLRATTEKETVSGKRAEEIQRPTTIRERALASIVPRGVTCVCGRFEKFSGYVYAHWTTPLIYTCGTCERKYSVLAGEVARESH